VVADACAGGTGSGEGPVGGGTGVGAGAGFDVGFEAAEMTVAAHSALSERLGELDGGPRLVATTGVVERVREVKDDDEVALIARACAIGDAALAELIDRGDLAPGTTERAAARSLEWLMYS